MEESCPEGHSLISVIFGEGSLGVSLRRVKETGKVTVQDIVPDSQAIQLDVAIQDHIWAVGEHVIGETKIDEEVWKSLLEYMKTSRPLQITFLRQQPQSQVQDYGIVPLTKAPMKPPKPARLLPPSDDNYYHQSSNDAVIASSNIPTIPQETTVIADTNIIPSSDEISVQNIPIQSTEDETHSELNKSNTHVINPDIQQLFSKIIIKQKNLSGISKLITQTMSSDEKNQYLVDNGIDLFKKGQNIYHQGDVGLLGSFALWNMQMKRHLVLLSDAIVIFIPTASNYEYESTIDILSCKINVRVRTGNALYDTISFDLLLNQEDDESIRIICKDETEKLNWIDKIYGRIFDSWGQPDTFAWKHNYILGSIHAAVVEGNIDTIKDMIAICDSGEADFNSLEEADNIGFTPLTYAVILKKKNIVKALLPTNPDVTVRDKHHLSALHWAALHLDEDIIQDICDHVLESDIDMKDDFGRTALFLACAEGKDENGESNNISLAKCIRSLSDLGANANIDVSDAKGLPIHYIAASWQDQALAAIIAAGGNVIAFTNDGQSPLHLACAGIPLRTAAIEMTRILFGSTNREDSLERPSKDGALRTLKLLIQHGSRVNYKDSKGRTPLSILMDARDIWGDELFDAVEALLVAGARPDEDIRSKCPPGFVDEAFGVRAESPVAEVQAIGLKDKCFSSKMMIAERKNACNLCQQPLNLFRRKLRCPLCSLLCCDECTKKKASTGDAAVRVCDCCYNRCLQKITEAREEAFKASFKTVPSSIQISKKTDSVLSSVSFQDNDKTILFAGSIQTTNKEVNSVGKAMGGMNEAMQSLQMRGERLEATAEKSEMLMNASSEFAMLAKQLKEKQKNRWF